MCTFLQREPCWQLEGWSATARKAHSVLPSRRSASGLAAGSARAHTCSHRSRQRLRSWRPWMLFVAVVVVAGAFCRSCQRSCCHALAANVRCDGLSGSYFDGESVARIAEAEGAVVTFHWEDAARADLNGTLFGNCFGAVFVEGEELVFKRESSGALVWSSGRTWQRSEAEFQRHADHGEGDLLQTAASHKVATTVATMLFGSFFASVGVLYLVNFPDPDIRMYAYTMISTTMSVFAAVLLNQAIDTFLFEQVLYGRPPRGLGLSQSEALRWQVGVAYLVLAWWAMSAVCWHFRVDARLLRSLSSLGSHLLGFAGIFASDAFMRSGPSGERGTIGRSCATLLLAGACMLLLKRLAKAMRVRLLHAAEAGEAGEHDEAAEEIIDEAENETIALVAAFLLVIILCEDLLGRLPELEGEGGERLGFWQVRRLMAYGVAFGVLGGLMRVLSKRRASQRFGEQVTLCLVNTLAMCMCWSFLWGSLWGTQMLFRLSRRVDDKLVRVINAFVVTSVCVILIFFFDAIADAVESERKRETAGDSTTADAEVECVLEEVERARTLLELPGARQGTRPAAVGSEAMQVDHLLGEIERASTILSEYSGRAGLLQDGAGVGALTGPGARSAALDLIRSRSRLTSIPEPRQPEGYERVLPGLLANLDLGLDLIAIAPKKHEISTLLRITLNSLGFLVALSWDKAFDSAEETVVHFVWHVLHFEHVVIVKVTLAFLLAGFVVPAWMKFIMPVCMKDRDTHSREVARATKQTWKFALGKLGHHGAVDLGSSGLDASTSGDDTDCSSIEKRELR